jgi:hypothetical protein
VNEVFVGRCGRGAVVVAGLIGLTLVAPAAYARMSRMFHLRLEGYAGPPPEGRREEADLTLRVGEADQRFQVTKGTLLSGGGLASQVFDRVAPYKPNFILRGPKELLARVTDAPPGRRLVITGEWRAGMRDFFVGSVEDGTPAP